MSVIRAVVRGCGHYLPERVVENAEFEKMVETMKRMREDDPYAVLQEEEFLKGKDGGQFSTLKLAPNFEMAMYVAQATGAAIVTDHSIRWKEMLFTICARGGHPIHHLTELADTIQTSRFSLPQHYGEILEWWLEGKPQPHSGVFRDVTSSFFCSRFNDKTSKSS